MCVCVCVCVCVWMYADKKRRQEIYSHRLFVRNGPKWIVWKFQEKNEPFVRAGPLFVQWVHFPRKNCFPGNCVQKNFRFEILSWSFKVVRTLSEESFDSEREKFGRDTKTAFYVSRRIFVGSALKKFINFADIRSPAALLNLHSTSPVEHSELT